MKKTKKEMFAEIQKLEGITKEQFLFLDHEIDLLNKKAQTKSSGNKKKKAESDIFKSKIYDYIKTNGRQKPTDLAKALDVTIQKVVGTIGYDISDKNENAPMFTKVIDKRQAYYDIVETITDTEKLEIFNG